MLQQTLSYGFYQNQSSEQWQYLLFTPSYKYYQRRSYASVFYRELIVNYTMHRKANDSNWMQLFAIEQHTIFSDKILAMIPTPPFNYPFILWSYQLPICTCSLAIDCRVNGVDIYFQQPTFFYVTRMATYLILLSKMLRGNVQCRSTYSVLLRIFSFCLGNTNGDRAGHGVGNDQRLNIYLALVFFPLFAILEQPITVSPSRILPQLTPNATQSSMCCVALE